MCQRFLADKAFIFFKFIYLQCSIWMNWSGDSVWQRLTSADWSLPLAIAKPKTTHFHEHEGWTDGLLNYCAAVSSEKKKYKHIKIRARRVYFCHVETEAHQNLTLKKQKNKSTNFSKLIQISKKQKPIYSCLLPSAKNAHFERRQKQGACHWVERVQALLWHHKMT